MKKTLLLLILLVSRLAEAQSIDSIHRSFSADSVHIWRKTLAKPFLKIENRYSFISSEQVNLLGLMAGATFINRHTVFIGYFFVDPRHTAPFEFSSLGEVRHHYLQLNHFVTGYQYVALNRRFIQVNIPFLFGYGRYKLEVLDEHDKIVEVNKGPIYPFSAGLQFIVKPLNWLGASVSGGYRYIGKKPTAEIVLEGWYYSFGIWLDGRQIIRSLKYRSRVKRYRKELVAAAR